MITPVLNFSFGDVIQPFVLLSGIMVAWIALRVRLTKIETGNDLKIAALHLKIDTEIENLRKEHNLTLEGLRREVELKIAGINKEIILHIEGLRKEIDVKIKAVESKTTGLADFLGARYSEFVNDNKEGHKAIQQSVDGIERTVNEINVRIAKL
jgi:hypothetical protein